MSGEWVSMDTLTKLEKSLILTLLGLILSFGIAYGRLTYQVADQSSQLARQQRRIEEISKVAIIVQFQLMYGKGIKIEGGETK